MKRLVYVLVLGLVVFTAGCDMFKEDASEAGSVTVQGQVLDAQTNDPLIGALVRILPLGLEYETDSLGRFEAGIEIDSTMDLTITASMNLYSGSSEKITVVAGRSSQVLLRLSATAEAPPTSGLASNILLMKTSETSIGVKESGSKEVAQITFQLADSLGRPVVLDNQVVVSFRFGTQPGGGEFLSPATARTDNNGQVSVNLSSGTRAGVVQIVAETTSGGRTIRSTPVAISIHGGLPAQGHFSLGPAQFNVPGLNRYGVTDAISVIVGDRYANPVKPGTSVYFTTSHGVVQGSTLTNATGQGTVNFITAEPMPDNGSVAITATTADENQNAITARIPLVISGLPFIEVSHSVAELGRNYVVHVYDQNQNPLAAGTSVTVKAEGTKVKAVGMVNTKLLDTGFADGIRDLDGNGSNWDGTPDGDILDFDDIRNGSGITRFEFMATTDNNVDEVGDAVLDGILIVVDGPNGHLELMLPRADAQYRVSKGGVVYNKNGRMVATLAD